jgi:hypothetical protein
VPTETKKREKFMVKLDQALRCSKHRTSAKKCTVQELSVGFIKDGLRQVDSAGSPALPQDLKANRHVRA